MPFKLSFPDLARRLARGLGVLGKTPVQLDETAVQTVLIRDLTLPEFARIPVEWSVHGVIAAFAAVFSIVGIRCESGVLVVKQMRAFSTSVATLTLHLNRVALNTPSGFFTSRQLHVLNRPGEEQLVVPSSLIGATSGGAVPGVIIDQSPDVLGLVSTMDIVLFPGDELTVSPSAQNEAVDAHFSGKQYPDLR